MEKIENILKKIITKEQKKEYEKFLLIEKKWNKNVDEKIKKAAKVIDYKEKTIIIKTKNPSWKNELNFMKTQLKKNCHPQKTQLNT